ncbi:MAG: hypothetical protein IE922_01600 [Sphingomonadales bacterium]|nr:hypothetical protein [Sphingomonadales bacterium]
MKLATKVRMVWIDGSVLNGRPLRRGHLCEAFGISVPQASLDLGEFRRRWPDRLVYDAAAKVYRAAPGSSPVFDADLRITVFKTVHLLARKGGSFSGRAAGEAAAEVAR